MVEIDSLRDHFCCKCNIVTEKPTVHRDEVHDNDPTVDIHEVMEDGDEFIAQPQRMGHFTPHVWIEVDNYEVCGTCSAVKIPDSVERWEPSD